MSDETMGLLNLSGWELVLEINLHRQSGIIHRVRKMLSPIYARQDVTLIWTRHNVLYVAGKSKFLVEHFLLAIRSRSWRFHIRTWTRNVKLARLTRFISFKIWHRYAPRNATSFWISCYLHTKSHVWFISGCRPDAYRLGFNELWVKKCWHKILIGYLVYQDEQH